MVRVVNKQNNSAHCIVCGDKNPLSMNTRFYDTENGETVAIFHPTKLHEGYPRRMHGGMVAAVLDETIGRAMWIDGKIGWGVTVELNVRYKLPVPSEGDLKCVGRIDEDKGRLAIGSGEIYLEDGRVAATATGKYMKMDPSKITAESADFLKDEWYLLEGEEDPVEV
jgi:acyl-coenzyme A thioesterase PaaI-like protein